MPALQAGYLGGSFQGGVEYDAVIVGVVGVAVGVPVLLPDMQFHVALDQAQPLHFQQGIAKVRPGGSAGAPRIEHPHPPAAAGVKLLLPGRPFLPQPGQQLLRYVCNRRRHNDYRFNTNRCLCP